MQKFVAQQNINHFRALLNKETDSGRRALLERMLEEEEAKLAAATQPAENDSRKPSPSPQG